MTNTPAPQLPILLIDDEQEALDSTSLALRSEGLTNLLLCSDSREVESLVGGNPVGVILLDLSMPHIPGRQLLNTLVEGFPEIPVIIITGAYDLETAVDCMRDGAFDYMVKPVEHSRLISGIRRAIEIRELRTENVELQHRVLDGKLTMPSAFQHIITQNPAMQAIFKYIEAVAPSTKPILITGETGAGKELLALACHAASRRQGKFLAVNVAGLEDTAFSDTLFGHRRGAYTGAEDSRSGLLQETAGGTLVLDEIGDLSPASQVKLLRVLQSNEYFPLGSDTPRRSDTRLVVTTNRDLQAMRDDGRFRTDLYFRLTTHHVHIPPLRERMSDLPLLIDHFLAKAASSLDKPVPTPPDELITLLSTYSFPGNLRELESMVFDAVSNHTARKLSMAVFKKHIAATRNVPAKRDETKQDVRTALSSLETFPTLREITEILIESALDRSNNNQTLAAEMLGISQSSLSKRLKRARRKKAGAFLSNF